MHQSKALVELSPNIFFLKTFAMISGLKNPKNRVKIRFKISYFGP